MASPNQTSVIKFNGINSYGSVPDNDVYSYVTNNGLTVSAWLRPDSISMLDQEGTGYVEWLNKTGNSKNEWLFRIYSSGNSENRENRISFYHFTSTGGLGSGASFQDVIVPEQWIHVVGKMDTQYIYIYKNGIFRNKDDWTAFPITPSNTTSTIRVGVGGDNSDSQNSFLQGALADIKIYNRALSEAEILDLYHGVAVTSGLVGYFKGDETTGDILTDSSVTANNGTLTNVTHEQVTVSNRKLVYDNPPLYTNITNKLTQRKSIYLQDYSISLNGTSQNLGITNSSQIGLNVGLSDFAVGGWFKLKDNVALQVLMSKYSGAAFANNASGVGWELLYRGDQASKGFNFRMNDGSASGVSLSFTSATGKNIANGEWHHIAVFIDRSAKGYLFLDGGAVGSGTISTRTGTLDNTGNFYIGRQSGTGTGGWLKGSVANCFLYNFGVNGLTVSDPAYPEIVSIYSDIYLKNYFQDSGLVSRWTLNNTPNDIVGNNNLTETASPAYTADSANKIRVDSSNSRTLSGTRTTV